MANGVRHWSRSLVSVALAAVLASAAAVGAQPPAERLDVGSFTLFEHEQRVGREQFSLQRVTGPDGQAFELRAESAVSDRRTAMRLEADSAGTPIKYSIEERTGAAISLRLGGQRVRGRFQTLARSTTGESAREYLLLPGALVLEDDGILQYAMLVRRASSVVNDTVSIPVLTPIANRQGATRIVLESTTDTVSIAGSRRPALRWRVLSANNEVRIVWADIEHRLLRIRIPARSLEALRDDVPR